MTAQGSSSAVRLKRRSWVEVTCIVMKRFQYLALEAKPQTLPDVISSFLCDFKKLFNLDAQPQCLR